MTTMEQALAEIATLKAQLAVASAPRAITLKVSEKGACSLYGMGKWPVTLYKGQWARVFAAQAQIEAFIVANNHLLAEKPAK